MATLDCTIVKGSFYYNCDENGDGNWYSSNNYIYAGNVKWGLAAGNGQGTGRYNWRTVFKITVPSSLSSYSQVEKLVLCVDCHSGCAPYHNKAVLSAHRPSKIYNVGAPTDPYGKSDDTGLYASAITTESSGKDTGIGTALANKKLAESWACDSNGNRITDSSYGGKVYYTFETSNIQAGDYYIYMFRNGTYSCGSCSSHGYSGYVSSTRSEISATVYYQDKVNLTINGKYYGTPVADFSTYGTMSIKIGNETKTLSTFNSDVPYGTTYGNISVTANSGYVVAHTPAAGTVTSATTLTPRFGNKYTVKFGTTTKYFEDTSQDGNNSWTTGVSNPTSTGQTFAGWKCETSAGTVTITGTTITSNQIKTVLGTNAPSTALQFNACFDNNNYTLRYAHYNDLGVKFNDCAANTHSTQTVTFNNSFTIPNNYNGTEVDLNKYEFSRYTLVGESGTEYSTNITKWNIPENATCNVYYDKRTYTIKFEQNGTALEEIDIKHGSAIECDKVNLKLWEKLSSWVFEKDGKEIVATWENIEKYHSNYKITLYPKIEDRYQIIVYKNNQPKRYIPKKADGTQLHLLIMN